MKSRCTVTAWLPTARLNQRRWPVTAAAAPGLLPPRVSPGGWAAGRRISTRKAARCLHPGPKPNLSVISLGLCLCARRARLSLQRTDPEQRPRDDDSWWHLSVNTVLTEGEMRRLLPRILLIFPHKYFLIFPKSSVHVLRSPSRAKCLLIWIFPLI